MNFEKDIINEKDNLSNGKCCQNIKDLVLFNETDYSI